MICEYKKTYTGGCDMQAALGNNFCYYHDKVSRGLIEADPLLALRQAQTIINK